MRRVGIVAKPDAPRAPEVVTSLVDWLTQRRIEVILEKETAGATIRFGSAGTGRFGSRKKAIVKRKSARKTSDNHAETSQTATPADARSRRIQRASKRVCERIRDRIFRVQNRMVK